MKLLKKVGMSLFIVGILLNGCSSGGKKKGGGDLPVGVLSGSVSGTTVIAVDDTGKIVASDDTAGKTADANGNFPFELTGIPTKTNIRVFLITGGGVYPMYFDSSGGNGSPDTNVFSLGAETTITLGFVDTEAIGQDGRAIPQNSPTGTAGVSAGAENAAIPAALLNPDASGLSFAQALSKGLQALKNGWVLGGRAYLQKTVELAGETQSNEADTARFFYAGVRVAAVGFETTSDGNANDVNRLGDILDKLGCDPSDALRANFDALTCPETLPADSPRGAEYQKLLYNILAHQLERAIENLNGISSGFKRSETFDGETVEFDHADALALRSGMKGLLATLAIQQAYDLDADIDADDNDPASTTESFLAANPGFLNLKDVSKLDKAKQFLTSSALDDALAAIDAIQAETDDQTDDLLNMIGETQAEIDQAKADIQKVKDCINGLPCPTSL